MRRNFRRFRKPVQRRRTAWQRGAIALQNFTFDQTHFEYTVFDANLNMPEMETQGNLTCLVKRIIVRGGLQWIPNNTETPTGSAFAINAVLYVIDKDDPDAGLGAFGSGTIMVSNRILWCDCYSKTHFTRDYTPNAPSPDEASWRIDIDWKGGVKVRPDEVIVLGMQTVHNISSLIGGTPQLNAQLAVLWVPT